MSRLSKVENLDDGALHGTGESGFRPVGNSPETDFRKLGLATYAISKTT